MTYWKARSAVYENLDWLRNKDLMATMLSTCCFRKSDTVLDAGTGTGVVAKSIAPLVRSVVAIDSSPDMLRLAPDGQHNIDWVVGDLRDLAFPDNTFDVVVARYVFHHIVDGAERAMAECYRTLKPEGIMIFVEGVPPSSRTKQDFINIFKLKEKRLTFMPEDMADLMTSVGFSAVRGMSISLRQMSIRNWLESGAIPKVTQDVIFGMHRDAPEYFKKDYNMSVTSDDCLIDMKVEIMTGFKS